MQDQLPFSLRHLSDDALLEGLTELSRSQHGLTAALVAHLAEMDARRLHLSQAAPSLFAYCVERLGFSEDEACRRIEAARLARTFPCIFPKLESGAISLSVLGKLKPFLTQETVLELLEAVSEKSVRQAERVLAARFPKPDIADSIRKLPESRTVEPAAAQPAATTRQAAVGQAPVAAGPAERMPDTPAASPAAVTPAAVTSAAVTSAAVTPAAVTPAAVPVPADRGRVSPLSAERVQVKFTASRTLEEKLELARDLMSHSNPRGDLATVIEAALDLLIAERMKQKFGQNTRAQKPRAAKRSRVTNATRREVIARDGLQCSFVDPSGHRCTARAFLELDHREPTARGGGSDSANVRVLCAAHNQAEAERVFGKAHMTRARRKRNLDVRDGATPSYQRGWSTPNPSFSVSSGQPKTSIRCAAGGRTCQPHERE